MVYLVPSDLDKLTTRVTYMHKGAALWTVEQSPDVPRAGETVELESGPYKVINVVWSHGVRLNAKVNLR